MDKLLDTPIKMATKLVMFCVVLQCFSRGIVAKEYCQMESFDASCPPDHVILVTSASYGRMKLGRCLTRDYYVGCNDDVTGILHERCSGKTRCKVTIPDPTLYEKQHCPKDLVSYLDAEFSCLQVTHFPNDSCKNNRRDVQIQGDGGFIAGYQPVSSMTPFSTNCPLVLHAPRGQKINITLYEFFNKEDSSILGRQGQQYQCIVLATVKEHMGEGFRENVVCGSGGHRQELVYSSKTHEVAIEINRLGENRAGGPRFLLQYQAIGCKDPTVPDDMNLQRRGDQLDVRCNNTGQVWHLVCRGSSWVGEFGNCTTDLGGMHYEGEKTSKRTGFPNAGIVMAIVVGIVLGIMIGFCLLLVVYNVRRKRRKNTTGRAATLERTNAQMTAKYPEGTYGANDPMLPGSLAHPDLTMDKGCHMICDMTGTGTVLRRDRDHVYEKPQSGMEIQCLLSQGKHHDPMVTMTTMDAGDYGCHLHGPNALHRGEKFEMLPPPPSCIVST